MVQSNFVRLNSTNWMELRLLRVQFWTGTSGWLGQVWKFISKIPKYSRLVNIERQIELTMYRSKHSESDRERRFDLSQACGHPWTTIEDEMQSTAISTAHHSRETAEIRGTDGELSCSQDSVSNLRRARGLCDTFENLDDTPAAIIAAMVTHTYYEAGSHTRGLNHGNAAT